MFVEMLLQPIPLQSRRDEMFIAFSMKLKRRKLYEDRSRNR